MVESFLAWVRNAPADRRAEGARSLARAYLSADFAPDDRDAAALAMTALLDDPSASVRLALSEALADSDEAPLPVIHALANDHSTVAAPVLSRSPLLGTMELVDCAALGDAFAQSAIACRPDLPPPVCAALAEIGAREAIVTLCVNRSARIPEVSFRRILARFGSDGEVREAMLWRPDLSGPVRIGLLAATAQALQDFVVERDWVGAERADRIAREARERGTVAIGADVCEGEPDEAGEFAAYLRAGGHLTPRLILRTLLSGERGLFDAALTELSGLPAAKVAGLVDRWSGAGFAALYDRAGLPPELLPIFRAALAAHAELARTRSGAGRGLSRPLVERVLSACIALPGPSAERTRSMLHRFQAEALRDAARLFSSEAEEKVGAAGLLPAPLVIEPEPGDGPRLDIVPALLGPAVERAA